MTRRADTALTRWDFHAAQGVLLVVRNPPPPPAPVPGQPAAVPGNPVEGVEILVAVWDDGTVTALNGHVDLGTGIRTALAQIVAEELDVALSQVNMVLGDTTRAPNQGATIASASIQIHAAPLRIAAAQARAWLDANGGTAALAGQHVQLMLDASTRTKPVADYTLVGTSAPRVDLRAKAMGELTFVHDMRMPGMLHGRVVRPPYAGADHGDFIGNTLESVDESSIAHIPGIRGVVVIRDFVGVVAEREEDAEAALAALKVQWKQWPGLPPLEDIAGAIRANPSTKRTLVDEGDVDAAINGAAQAFDRQYVWPYQLHASIGPSCAVADWRGVDNGNSDSNSEGNGASPKLTVWAGTQNPHVLRADIAKLMGLADVQIDLIRMEAAGCYGRNCADDVAADAALLSRAVGAPVRVQLTREQEHLWEPKGTAQLMTVRGALGDGGGMSAYDFETSYPSNGAPTLALLLTRTVEPEARSYEMGDRTARPPYTVPNLRVAVNDMAPIVRASWLRGVSALPNSFAHESYIDELATAAGVDPVEYRLRHLDDERAAELVRATAERAGWTRHTLPQQQPDDGEFLRGQGFAYARYVHSKWPGFGAAWAAWVADVDVNRRTGEVHVRRVVVGHDAGMLINPAGVEHQVHGNVLQTTSRALKEEVTFAPRTDGPGLELAAREWGSYPLLSFREVPVVEVMHMPRPGEAPLGAGESSSVPGTAAIANAIFDATGVRFRNPPFTPDVVRAAINPLTDGTQPDGSASAKPLPVLPSSTSWPTTAQKPKTFSFTTRALALFAGVAGMIAALVGWRISIPPVLAPVLAPTAAMATSPYSNATLERGRLLASAGDCAVCHTSAGGAPNAGGRAMQTPFGTIYTTNLTPDAETGIGTWSYTAFERAMRQGISRDGHHLYPAFPYTSFARMTDDDLQALYGYLMTQPAVKQETPKAELKFPYSVRPLMSVWNGLFHDTAPYASNPQQTAEWNRGAYLVNGVGHCGGCHTPRNAMGAEMTSGTSFLAGTMVDGWEAPALTNLSRAPVPWTAQSLFDYLRRGHSAEHGIAAGPMAPVIHGLAPLPDDDIRAMATYLASFNAAPADNSQARQWVATAAQTAPLPGGTGQRLFDGACASCHHDGDGPKLLGVNVPLALNTNLHADRPDNLIRTILEGVREPAARDIGFMQGFADVLSDQQVAEIAGYMRQRYAPGREAWTHLPATVARLRASR